jgi:dissimilatory sulfite reductase (desulfoviridin) alpha/beta subunit
MSAARIVQKLLAEAKRDADRREARAAWVDATVAAWGEAQRQMDERLTAIVEQVSEEEFERLCDEEEAKVDAFRVPLQAAAERDVWPRELYFGCV